LHEITVAVVCTEFVTISPQYMYTLTRESLH
jgi:hypothetical protein